MSYAMICMSTDYDSWHDTNETVSVEMVMGHMTANADNAKRIVGAVLNILGEETAMENKDMDTVRALVGGKQWEGHTKFAAGMTKIEGRKKNTVEKLRWLFPDYF